MPDHIPDHWNQNFGAFKSAFSTSNLNTPSHAIFKAQELRDLLSASDVSHIVIYPVRCPDQNGFDCVAAAVGLGPDPNDPTSNIIVRKRPLGMQYIVAVHNCPPDCTRAPGELIESTNLRNTKSID
jgi:hypothetical protein